MKRFYEFIHFYIYMYPRDKDKPVPVKEFGYAKEPKEPQKVPSNPPCNTFSLIYPDLFTISPEELCLLAPLLEK
jgi:hypothetical protein